MGPEDIAGIVHLLQDVQGVEVTVAQAAALAATARRLNDVARDAADACQPLPDPTGFAAHLAAHAPAEEP